MPVIVLIAELATLAFIVTFCIALASDGIRGPVFTITTKDVVARTLLRSVQAAFVLGYCVFFASTAFQALGWL